jgi:type II secretory pathway pseudopilin PulG
VRVPARAGRRGFTYLGVLVLMAVIGLASALTLQVAETVARRGAERELAGVGREFADAIRAYARQAPNGTPRYPRRLEDLLKDPRVPFTRRYLRRIYADPMTGRAEWGTVASTDGGIVGVYSLAGNAGERTGSAQLQSQVAAQAMGAGATGPNGSTVPAPAAPSTPSTASPMASPMSSSPMTDAMSASLAASAPDADVPLRAEDRIYGDSP